MVIDYSGAQPRQHNDRTDKDNDGSYPEMDPDDLLDFEYQDPHVPSSSTANVGPYA